MVSEIAQTDNFNDRTNIKVVGVGGAGGNAVNRMIAEGLQNVQFVAINTDAKDLLRSDADVKISLNDASSRGLGAGADPERGSKAAQDHQSDIEEALKGADMVFVTCGEGGGTGGRIMNPQTVVYLEEGASIQMDTVQIRGVDSTKRYTKIVCGKGAEAVITERLLTHGRQVADSDMVIELNGEDAKGRVISRSVAQDESSQVFRPCVVGNAKCFGHVQCDSIIMGQAKISSVPEIAANDTEAQLIHEAAIGKIAGDQLLKLETLGLTEEEAEDRILKGFLA